jgi:hypothetical protein
MFFWVSNRVKTLLADLQHEQDSFAREYWCYDPDSYRFRYGTTCPYLPAHWSESFWPSWAAHPSKFCGPHDGGSPIVFLVRHRGEWVHPDDVDH